MSPTMDADRWRQLQDLLHAAWELAPDDRSSYLDRHCDDPELRRKVDALLAADGEADDYFERLASDAGVTSDDAAAPVDLSGRRVGNYELLEPLGRGGMGVVYLAERADGAFDQQVAVKLLAMGLAGPEGHRRFVAERQILAGLEHPAIARLLDGGVTEDGTPYFVMERVEGERIDAWCDARRLGVRQRVELLSRVCGAVEYAHRKLIVHRDLKPANLLVTGQGDPKLLDFGVAKLLSEVDADFTRSRGAVPLTPAWAAPEQVEGGAVTTATDTYALGALAYRLLAGVMPHEIEELTPAAALRRLRVEPAVPSRRLAALPPTDQVEIARARGTSVAELRRALTGDLDAILRCALAPDPERRYGSAGELAADFRSYLDARPVTARAPRLGYRLSRFVARHRVTVAAAAVVAALLVSLVVVSIESALSSRRQALRVAAERDRAEEATAFLKQLFRANDPDIAQGQMTTARDLLDQGARQVSGAFGESPGLRAEMLILLGDLYSEIGEYDAARPLLVEGLALADAGGELDSRVEALQLLGQLDTRVGRYAPALAELERAERLLEAAGLVPSEPHAALMHRMRFTLSLMGRVPESVQRTAAALALARADANLSATGLFDYLFAYGNALQRAERHERAEALFREAIALDLTASDAPSRRLQVHSDLASVLNKKGDHDGALRHQRQAVALAERIYPPAHGERARMLNNLGNTLTYLGRLDEAEVAMRQALEINQTIFPDTNDDRLATNHNNLGIVLFFAERYTEAEPHMVQAREMRAAALGRRDSLYAAATANLGDLLIHLGRAREAEELLLEALEVRRAVLGPESSAVGSTQRLLAKLRLAENRPEEAIELADQALALFGRIGYQAPNLLLETYNVRARAFASLGRDEEADLVFAEAMTLGEAAGPDAGRGWPRLLAAYAELLVDRDASGAAAAVARALAEHRSTFGEAHPATQRLKTLARAD